MVISGPAEFVERAEAGQPPQVGGPSVTRRSSTSATTDPAIVAGFFSRAGCSDGHGDACALRGPEEIGKQADSLGGYS